MRCGRCGNENAEDNRFCGMCGAPLRTGAAAPARQASAPAGNVAAQRPNAAESAVQAVASAPAEARPRAASEQKADVQPTISGPSFLGLNQPAPAPPRSTKRDESHGDGWEHLRASRNLDYLLEDDQEEPKRGWGKLVFILVALALAGGFGYLRWKTGGFDWLTAGVNKPAATQPAADTAQKPADNGAATANPAAGAGSNESGTSAVPSGTAAPNAAAAGSAGTAAAPSGPATVPTGAAAVPTSPGSASATGTTPPSASQTTSQSATPTPQAAGAPENPAPSNAAPNTAPAAEQANGAQSNSGAPAAGAASSGTGAATESSQTESSQEGQTAQPSTPAHRAAVKPAAPKPAPAKPVDSVAEAQRYIYGRGVGQDCDRGMHMLKSAANRSDAKAMISLGALYSTGTCAPRDLPTAYRWFAMGLHKDPNNQALQDDLQKLWSQMTQPERQLAIKLSQ
ncbi:MAG: zinc-ribbon domain-containing protein [Candidatus Sulfotelmatobacter sp.]